MKINDQSFSIVEDILASIIHRVGLSTVLAAIAMYATRQGNLTLARKLRELKGAK